MVQQVDKLRRIATNIKLTPQERKEAIEMLREIAIEEALLALLDIANDTNLSVEERELAQQKARELRKSKRLL